MARTSGSPYRNRFHEAYVPEPMSGCWLWLRHTDRDGYGRLWLGKGRETGAHRFSFEAVNGPVSVDLRVLHRCDTPCCVNPDHLFIGSQGDNMRDAAKKGRVRFEAPLSEEVRAGILASTVSRNATAKQFGVSSRTVQGIWKSTRTQGTQSSLSIGGADPPPASLI